MLTITSQQRVFNFKIIFLAFRNHWWAALSISRDTSDRNKQVTGTILIKQKNAIVSQ